MEFAQPLNRICIAHQKFGKETTFNLQNNKIQNKLFNLPKRGEFLIPFFLGDFWTQSELEQISKTNKTSKKIKI